MDDLERVKQILASHGIKIMVGGCGCHDSPWFKMTYKGELIEERDNCNFDMFEEKVSLPKPARLVRLEAYPDCPICLGTGMSRITGEMCNYCIGVHIDRGHISKDDCVIELARASEA